MIYVIGSLRSPRPRETAAALRTAGFSAFDDWQSPGPDADDYWRDYERERGHTFREALYGPSAMNTFLFDKKWLDACDSAVLVMPAGKSAHLELGYILGQGKPGFILMDGEPERFDVMYNFATYVCMSLDELVGKLHAHCANGRI